MNGKWVVYGMGNMIAQQETNRANTYEGITVRFLFTEQKSGRFLVSRAAYVPTTWNVLGAGRPIRIQRVVRALQKGRGNRAHLLGVQADIRAAVNGHGRHPLLLER